MPGKILTFLAVTVLIAGCAANSNKPGKRSDATFAAISNALEEAKNSAALPSTAGSPPKEVSDALLPNYKPGVPVKFKPVAHEERFDITVNRMSARSFFMSLVKDTPINMVVHPQVKGSISLNLKSVTVDEVLEVARDVYGYEYQKNRAGYFVLPARLQSKIFNVSYLNVSRDGMSNTRVTSGQFTTAEGTGNRGGAGNNNNNVNRQGGNSSQTFASSRIATVSKSDFWKDLENTVKTIIGNDEGRSVVVSPQSGLVVVRAMPGQLRDVESFLKSAQANLHRQVIIEAKVVEVQLNDDHQTGINWAKIDQGGSRDSFGSQFEIIDGDSELINSTGDFLLGGVTGTNSLQGFGNLFAVGAASDDFAFIIRLLDQQGDVNVLSSPRVSTVNNQKAVIKIGSDEFFVTEVSSTTTTGTSTTTTPEIILTPFFSGIALDVTPQINENKDVILHIHPTISEVVDQVKDITIAGQDQSLPLAFSTVRESDSVVRARSGQVIVIGGLMQESASDTVGGVPGLRNIPVLGHLFRQTKRVSKRSELVILLKPIVISDSGYAWQSELSRISDRIEKLKR